jgi:hypothetical protein
MLILSEAVQVGHMDDGHRPAALSLRPSGTRTAAKLKVQSRHLVQYLGKVKQVTGAACVLGRCCSVPTALWQQVGGGGGVAWCN